MNNFTHQPRCCSIRPINAPRQLRRGNDEYRERTPYYTHYYTHAPVNEFCECVHFILEAKKNCEFTSLKFSTPRTTKRAATRDTACTIFHGMFAHVILIDYHLRPVVNFPLSAIGASRRPLKIRKPSNQIARKNFKIHHRSYLTTNS